MSQALAHLGSFEFNYPGDESMYWSDEVFRILGREAEAVIRGYFRDPAPASALSSQ